MDRGAWWAAIHGVTQSRTRLKQLSTQVCIGEGNGNPLHYSCLENLKDTGTRWAAVYGAAQSWPRLKQPSSSSSSTLSEVLHYISHHVLYAPMVLMGFPRLLKLFKIFINVIIEILLTFTMNIINE